MIALIWVNNGRSCLLQLQFGGGDGDGDGKL